MPIKLKIKQSVQDKYVAINRAGIKFKSAPPKTTREHSSPLVVALVISIVFAMGGTAAGYFIGENKGWISGNESGYNNGKADGHDEGYSAGYNEAPRGYTFYDLKTTYSDGFEDARKCAYAIAVGTGGNIYNCFNRFYN